jgi:hypothetical protein
LLEGLAPQLVLADKAYVSDALRYLIASMGAEVAIPANRSASSKSLAAARPKTPEIPPSGA